MNDYSSLSYWEKRYTNEHLEIFEWYQTYEALKERIIEYIKPEDKILNIGCGTSKFAEDLFYEDIKNVTNIDFSESVIKLMQEHFHENQIETKCLKMDVMDMSDFRDSEFNVVFDKALLDSILCGENALDRVKKMLSEVYRVLCGGGYYIIVSNSDESYRKFLFDEDLWEYKCMEISKQTKCIVLDEKEKDPKNYHYIYVLHKKIKEVIQPEVVNNENVKKVEVKKEKKKKKKKEKK